MSLKPFFRLSLATLITLHASPTNPTVVNIQPRQRENLIRDFVARQKAVDINGTCATDGPTATPVIRNEIESLVIRFNTMKARTADPTGYITALDRIIELSGYGFLLACRDGWRSRQPYGVEFFDRTPPGREKEFMRIDEVASKAPDGSAKRTLTLHASLDSPIQVVTFTYMHELMHLCQKERSDELYKDMLEHQIERPESVLSVHRDVYTSEIEAFALMDIAYADFVRYSRKFCLANREGPIPPEKNFPWHELYAQRAEEIFSGLFPLRIISVYYGLEDHVDWHTGIILVETSEASYPRTRTEPAFKIRCLDLGMKKAIEKLGLIVTQDPSCPR